MKENCCMSNKLRWVKEWFKKAENDLKAAQIIAQVSDSPTDTVCFHAQQCAEKYLKAFLTLHDVFVAKTHDLVNLNNSCKDIDIQFGNLTEACEQLTGYAVEVRYPGDFCDYSIEEAKEAIKLAEEIKSLVMKKSRFC